MLFIGYIIVSESVVEMTLLCDIPNLVWCCVDVVFLNVCKRWLLNLPVIELNNNPIRYVGVYNDVPMKWLLCSDVWDDVPMKWLLCSDVWNDVPMKWLLCSDVWNDVYWCMEVFSKEQFSVKPHCWSRICWHNFDYIF